MRASGAEVEFSKVESVASAVLPYHLVESGGNKISSLMKEKRNRNNSNVFQRIVFLLRKFDPMHLLIEQVEQVTRQTLSTSIDTINYLDLHPSHYSSPFSLDLVD